ncbi:hypothetical protein GIB67_036409 [Kingdonia uniflora]|uniref:Elongator complex protein 5 n=1 Tax=Kingdonia uniflora TaxID=39325 RepID=A0A7J7L477_9MAGN|nr:hypothetical protein GIB67_036409 [Kingdonia uniflora]
MAEWVCRALGDGSLEGEHALALTIKDFISSAFGFDAFTHVFCSMVSNIIAGKSQARGVVLAVFDKSPSFYVNLLKSRGLGVASLDKWIRILDCYSDPLGWKDGSKESVNPIVTLYKDVRDLDKLFSSIVGLGKVLMCASLRLQEWWIKEKFASPWPLTRFVSVL